AAMPYFQRARGAELLELFERRFPNAARRGQLRASAVEAYSIHGATDAVLTSGTRYLRDFPNEGMRVNVSLLIAYAHAKKNQEKEELAIYDALLAELAQRAEGMPLGEGIVVQIGQQQATRGPRSPEYARVLDRYLSRLVALKRTRDALAVLRRELDRNPKD